MKINTLMKMDKLNKNRTLSEMLKRHGNIDTVQNFQSADHFLSYPLHVKEIEEFEYEFLKSYLYALYTRIKNDTNIELISFLTIESSLNPLIVAPKISASEEGGMCSIDNPVVYIHLAYMGKRYFVAVYKRYLESRNSQLYYEKHYISILGAENQAVIANKLCRYLIAQSVKNSFFTNRIIKIKWNDYTDMHERSILNPEEFKGETLENIFIPSNLKDELIKFKECVKNFGRLNKGMRYLLCGEPGTGKTKTIRSLIRALEGKATIIVTEGNIKFNYLIDFAKLFSPVIVCFDDLDILIGSREEHYSRAALSEFLQELDGFEKNDFFILATSNDKGLIDKAASRPGRFDMILDFGKLSKENYWNIVESRCVNPEVLKVLDEGLLRLLAQKRVTGAYVVNLVKQIEIKYELNPETDLREYSENLVQLSYKGFYKKLIEKEVGVG
ncbi:MAG: ATP-binding protein, partial [Ignavibacteria bacterium]